MSKGIGDNLARAFNYLVWVSIVGALAIIGWISYGIYLLVN